MVGVIVKEAALNVLERQNKQKPTNCLEPQICATHLTHTVSETEMLHMLPTLAVKIKTYLHDKKRVVRSGERSKKRKY